MALGPQSGPASVLLATQRPELLRRPEGSLCQGRQAPENSGPSGEAGPPPPQPCLCTGSGGTLHTQPPGGNMAGLSLVAAARAPPGCPALHWRLPSTGHRAPSPGRALGSAQRWVPNLSGTQFPLSHENEASPAARGGRRAQWGDPAKHLNSDTAVPAVQRPLREHRTDTTPPSVP